jgi:type III secretory pathway component EscR
MKSAAISKAFIPVKFQQPSCRLSKVAIGLLHHKAERMTMSRIWSTLLLGATLLTPIAARADDDHRKVKRYYDRDAKDWHEWNEREERAYRDYLKENRKEAHDWAKAEKKEQKEYWKWRHKQLDRH